MIRTVLVDDSPTFRALVTRMLEGSGEFKVVGVASAGEAAIELVERSRPDLVLMDVMLAGMDGLAATRAIMERAPCPVVVVSSLVGSPEHRTAFDALAAGAVDVLPKPKEAADADVQRRFVSSLKAMASLKVVRRRNTSRPSAAPRLVAIAASTGGPPAVASVLSALEHGFPAPIVIAQHIASGFTAGFARWLAEVSHFRVVQVTEPVRLESGVVYLPTDGLDLLVSPASVSSARPLFSDGATPSADRLFESCLSFGPGPGVVGVLLTGMGTDGAKGLAALRSHGHHTIAQDEATSLVFGMPRAAIEAQGAAEVLALEEIATRLNQLGRGRSA